MIPKTYSFCAITSLILSSRGTSETFYLPVTSTGEITSKEKTKPWEDLEYQASIRSTGPAEKDTGIGN